MTAWRDRDWRAAFRRYELAIVCATALAVLLPGLGSFTLIDPWEGHYGEVARRILEDNDWVKPRWQNEVFRSKPILSFWAMDGRTTPLTRFESDKAPLIGALDRIEATDTPADLGRALQAAADALRDRQNPLVVLIGDGAYREDQLGAVRWDPVPAGQSARLDTIDMYHGVPSTMPGGPSGTSSCLGARRR